MTAASSSESSDTAWPSGTVVPSLPFSRLAETGHLDDSPMLALAEWRRQGRKTALATIVGVEGSSFRGLGSQMAVEEGGDAVGYLTGGCLEAELAAVARRAIERRCNALERFGAGSRYMDMRLPCGGGLDVYFDQSLPDDVIFSAEAHILVRRPFVMKTELGSGLSRLRRLTPGRARSMRSERRGGKFFRLFPPSLQVEIHGDGLPAVQLAFLLNSLAIGATLRASNPTAEAAARALGVPVAAQQAHRQRDGQADPWTAAALMFHDHDKELPILMAILGRPYFYVGAVGGTVAATARRRALAEMGFETQTLARLRGPAGAIASARSATELALGIATEILDAARAGGLAA